jgi:hypothetical protein
MFSPVGNIAKEWLRFVLGSILFSYMIFLLDVSGFLIAVRLSSFFDISGKCGR